MFTVARLTRSCLTSVFSSHRLIKPGLARRFRSPHSITTVFTLSLARAQGLAAAETKVCYVGTATIAECKTALEAAYTGVTFTCMKGTNDEDCLLKVKSKTADVTVVGGELGVLLGAGNGF